MKILNLTTQLERGRGIARYITMLEKACAHLQQPCFTWAGVSPQGVALTPQISSEDFFKLQNEIITAKFDMIFVHGLLPIQLFKTFPKQTIQFVHDVGITCLSNRLKNSKPCDKPLNALCWAHGLTTKCCSIRPHNFFPKFEYLKDLKQSLNQFQIPIITVSQFLRNHLGHHGFNLKSIQVLEPYVEIPHTPAEDFALKLPPQYFLFVGGLAHFKGLSLILKALQRTHTSLPLVVCGEGFQENEFKAAVKRMGLEARIMLMGYQPPDKMSSIYQRCQFVIMPSLGYEGFGIVGIEAMSHGKAVIGSCWGGIPEWLKNGHTGVLLSQASPATLGQAIDQLCDDPSLCKNLGAQASATVQKKFNFDIFCEKLSSWVKPSR